MNKFDLTIPIISFLLTFMIMLCYRGLRRRKLNTSLMFIASVTVVKDTIPFIR